ncbi:MAG: response regulator [Acidimicrobiales bacterium]
MEELAGQGLRALIVDDDEAVRGLLRSALELDGWEVLEADDGVQALALARAERPHGVLLDVMMTHKDGFDVLTELRRTELGRAMAIVMLTAKTRPSDVLRGTRLGADLYVTKPFDPNHVVERLAFHARKRSPEAQDGRSAAARRGRRRAAPGSSAD